MKLFHAAPLRVLALAVLAPMLLVLSPMVVAQEVDRPCAEAVAPADDSNRRGSD